MGEKIPGGRKILGDKRIKSLRGDNAQGELMINFWRGRKCVSLCNVTFDKNPLHKQSEKADMCF